MHAITQSETHPLAGRFLQGRFPEAARIEMVGQLEPLMEEPRQLAEGERLVSRGQRATRASILLEGYMLRAIVQDGRRFIVGIHVPGDFVDLHGLVLKHLDHDVTAVGPARVSSVSHDALRSLTEARSDIAEALWFATLLDAAIHRQWIRNLEALDAPQRIAHLYAELHHRLTHVDRHSGLTLRTPFTQADIADMCGVSAIHANRAVARLRELGLGEIRRGDLYVRDWSTLERYAGFDPAYLYGPGRLSR